MAYRPHQFSCRDASMSDRYTFGFDPSLLFRIEKNPCSPDAKCVLCERHMAQSSLLAHAPVNKSTPSPSETCMIRERIDLLLSDCSSLPLSASPRVDRVRTVSAAAPVGHTGPLPPTTI